MPKCVVLGIDGGTFETLDPLIDTGRLPALALLLRGGVRATLLSTFPPVTTPAWPTMYTSQDPGVHGYTSFGILDPQTLVRRAERLDGVSCPRLWTVLNQAGVRTGIFNIPSTYPADVVDGFMVSGFPAPPGSREAVQPTYLRRPFTEAFPAYDCNGTIEVALFNDPTKRDHLVQQLQQILSQRRRALEWLLEREPVDFLWVVLETFDRIAHCAYAFLSPESDLHGSDEGKRAYDAILDLFETQDHIIKDVMEWAGSDSMAMVVSDHGFSWTPRRFDLRGWLISRDLMAPPRHKRLWQRFKGAVRSRLQQKGLGKFWQAVSNTHARLAKAGGRARWTGATWDWDRSKTWLSGASEYGIRINLRGRYVHGIVPPTEYDETVDCLVDALQNVQDPKDERPVFSLVKRREEVYHGPYVDRAPEVVYLPRRDVYQETRPLDSPPSAQGFLSPAPDLVSQGHHDLNGIFAATGRPFGQGQAAPLSIPDIMPTVLYAMGLGVPENLEGRVVTEVLDPGFVASHPVERSVGEAPVTRGGSSQPSYTEEEEEAIQKRLEELGYL